MIGETGSVLSQDRKKLHSRLRFRLTAVERPILFLRWLALLLVLILHWFDESEAGVFFSVPHMALAVAGYNGLLLWLMHYVGWLRKPLNSLTLDTVVATAAVYLTGGYHSSFFVLYVFIIIGAAFHLELARTMVATAGIGLIYVGACYVNPAGLKPPSAQYMLAGKFLLMLIVAVLCSLLLEQLRREHQETERERALGQRLRALNDLFQQLNITLDLDLTLKTVVEAPRSLLGADWTSMALLDENGQHLTAVATAGIDLESLPGEGLVVVDRRLANALCTGQPCVLEDPTHCPIGQQTTERATSVVCVPLLLDGKPLGMLGVAYKTHRDLSDEEMTFLQALGQEAALAIRNAHLYERERAQVARLRALEKLQESFVSSVSHELRTPLTCIKTSVDLLQATDADLSVEQRELIHTIGHHVSRLEALVSDLLEITKLEAGQITLSRQPTNLCLIAARVVQALHPLKERKGQTVSLHCPASVSPVAVDRRRIEQVLTNILSNAIKFTPKQGRIEIRVTEAPDEIQVCVSDNGPGIPPEEQGRVFDKFYVIADDRGLSGVGLGLYIARQVVELHGGRIWLESQVGVGSTFCFSVPKGMGGKEE